MSKPPKIYYVKRLIYPFRAMTVPPLGIFIKEDWKDDKQVKTHSDLHWKQYLRMGFFLYYVRYLLQLLIIGYDTMPMEMECRRFDSPHNRWNYRDKYHKKPSASNANVPQQTVTNITSSEITDDSQIVNP